MAGGAVGIAVENLLGRFKRVQWVLHQLNLSLGDQRRGTGAAEHLLEKSSAAGVLFRLGGAEAFAAIIKSGFQRENPREDGDGVVEILAVERHFSFFVLFADRPRNLIDRFFCHEWIL